MGDRKDHNAIHALHVSRHVILCITLGLCQQEGHHYSWAWWCILVILALGRWRQENWEFEANVSYIVTYTQGQLNLYEYLSQTAQREQKEGREGGGKE